MPKEKTKTKTRTVTKKIKSYVSRKPHTGGAVSGAVAGIAGVLVSKFLGSAWSQPVSDLGVGYFMKNDTLMTIGGRQIGATIASGSLGTVLGNGTTSGALLF